MKTSKKFIPFLVKNLLFLLILVYSIVHLAKSNESLRRYREERDYYNSKIEEYKNQLDS